jgi:hypothetical protein
VKAFLLVSAVILALSACDGASTPAPGPEPSAAPSGVSPAAAPKPTRLRVEVLATLPVEYDGPQRLALCGRHLAYVESQAQIVLTDWRSGTSRTVFGTDHSFLYAVRRRPCQLDVFDTVSGYNGEDPSEPGRNLSLNLMTGRLRTGPPLPAAQSEVPSRGTQGTTFMAEARHGYVFAQPTGGGRQVRLPGHLASAGGWPVANGDLLAYAVRVHGSTRIRVVVVTAS